MMKITSKNGRTYEYDYVRPAIDRKVWDELVNICEKLGQKPKTALEAAVRDWLSEKEPRCP
jgi:hypothetical protein